MAEIDGSIHVLENAENRDVSAIIQKRYNLRSNVIERMLPVDLNATSRSVYHFLKVARVNNSSSPQNRGLCWAACMASKIMYQTSYRNLTALDVFDKCWEDAGFSSYNVPEGSDKWYSIASSLYGSSITIKESLSSKGTTSNILSNGKPIILHINQKNPEIVHAVILCGLDEDASYMEFILMDPNVSDYVYLSLPNDIFSNPGKFYYGTNGVSYTVITRFMY